MMTAALGAVGTALFNKQVCPPHTGPWKDFVHNPLVSTRAFVQNPHVNRRDLVHNPQANNPRDVVAAALPLANWPLDLRRAHSYGSQTFVSLNSRLKGLLGTF